MGHRIGRVLLVVLISVVISPLVVAEEPPSQIRLVIPESPPAPGDTIQLRVELLGADGEARSTVNGTTIALDGVEGLLELPRLVVPAGESSTSLSVKVPRAGLWQIRATAKGLRSDGGVLVSPVRSPEREPVPQPEPSPPPPVRVEPEEAVESAEPDRSARERPEEVRRDDRFLAKALPPSARIPTPPAASPSEPPPPEPTGSGAPGTPEATGGTVLLLAEPARIHRRGGIWPTSNVSAMWVEGGVPHERDTAITLDIHAPDSTGGYALDPNALVIPQGSYTSIEPAKLDAEHDLTVDLVAYFSGGMSQPLKVEFLPAKPAKLSIPETISIVRGLARVSSEVYVSVLDDDDEPTETDDDLAVEVQVSGPDGASTITPIVIPSGSFQGHTDVLFKTHGEHTLKATAPGVPRLEAGMTKIVFKVAWVLIVFALVGGLAGAGIRMVLSGSVSWPRGVLRALTLGCFAAFLVLLMANFEVLSLLGLPDNLQKALEKIPMSNALGVLLAGIIAGLCFDLVYGKIAGKTTVAAGDTP